MHNLRHHDTLQMKPKTSQHSNTSTQVSISALLGFAVFGIYGRAIGYDFVLYDDLIYVVNNVGLRDGLHSENLFWIFTSPELKNWHPMTWVSYILDVEIFGFRPQGFHFTNILLHAMNSILLFWWLRDATKRLWCSALVAFLFAVHPLHVESVAWISERKDVLSTFFMLLTLIAYSRYVRKPLSRTYVAIEILFLCALLSKPMVVTLPLVLLLLDIWPYGRLSDAKSLMNLFSEKIPLFVLAGASAMITLIVQAGGGAIVSLDDWPLFRRPLTAMASYGIYALQTVFPVQLAVFYPRHWGLTFWLAALAGAVLVLAASYLSIRMYKRRPYFAVGWFWFLITLIPVIGVLQVGEAAHADRYMYIPQIGLLIVGTWLLATVVSNYPRLRTSLIGLCVAASSLYCVAAYKQVAVWENSEALFRNAVARSSESEWTHWALGKALLMESEKYDESLAHLDRALELKPAYSRALYTKARLLRKIGNLDEAESVALQIEVDFPHYVHSNRLLGEIYLERENYDEAVLRFDIVLDKVEGDVEARVNLGIALSRLGRLDEGIAQFGRAIELQPDHLGAYEELIQLLEAAGRHDEALSHRHRLDDLQSGKAER